MPRNPKDVGRAGARKAEDAAEDRSESKAERFERLAQRRVTNAVRQLRLIGNLSHRGNYEYTDEHVRQVFDALDAEMRHLRKRFQQQDSPSPRVFAFKAAKK